jgi:hypothetical protein
VTSNGGGSGGGGLSNGPTANSQPQPGGLESRQAYIAQQHQQQLIMQQQARAQALAASQAAAAQAGGQGGGGIGVGSGNQPIGYNMTPAQMQQAQMLAQQRIAMQQQQQQQQVAYATAQQTRGPPAAQTQTPLQNRKPALPPQPTTAQPPPPPTSAVTQPILDSSTPTVDVLDVLTSRQLAIHRLSRSQDVISPIFDPWSASAILAGHKRKREVDEAMKTEAADPRTGESRGGIAGFGREHTLTILGTSAARIAVHAAMGKDVKKATFSVEERREKLSAMLKRIKQETEMMEKRHAEVVAKVKAKPV